SGNTWTATDADISGLDNGTITVTADVTDVAGNPASDANIITLDNTPPNPVLTIDDVTADNLLSADERNGNIAITGTVTGDFNTGDTVTISINGINYTGTVTPGGLFSITVPGTELAANPDVTIDGSITTTDVNGNSNTAIASKTYDLDNDGDGVPDSTDTDDDNDGVPDGTDNAPLDPSSCQDLDGDGCDDCSATASNDFTPSPNFDTANDGEDTDGDGLCNSFDEDDDNDGIPDVVETTADFDNDGVPNSLDLDSDNDGIPDIVETDNASLDSNGNGKIDDTESPAGTNGIPDSAEDGGTDGNGVSSAPVDSDGSGSPNYLDIDSDNDGILDTVEAQADGSLTQPTGTDTDADGIDDAFDTDESGSFITAPINSDSDTHPDYLDLDSDDDGIVDNIEWQSTSSYLPPSADSDGNGLADNYETAAGSGQSINQPVNSDGQDNPDFRDTDSDNDGLSDYIEAYDTDADNTADTSPLNVDTDNDGLDDAFDNSISAPNGIEDSNGATNNGQVATDFPNDQDPFTAEVDFRDENVHLTPIDTDGDGYNDDVDIDDDNDGILDYVESLGFEPTNTQGDDCGIPPGSFTNGTYIGGTGLGAGTVNAQYRFSNVVTSSLGVLDAIVTITEMDANVTFNTIDSNAIGSDDAWQPSFDINGIAGDTGSVTFSITLVAAGTNFQVNLSRFGGAIYDIDGADVNESVTLARPGLYALDSNTLINTSENLATGTVTFNGPNQSWAGVDFGPRLAMYFNYYETYEFRITFTGELLAGAVDNSYLGSVLFQTCDINGLFDPSNTTSSNNTAGTPTGVTSGPGTAPVFVVNDGIDSDNDGISDDLDIDSDNDGIPDNVEAQLTSAYTAPGTADSDFDGLLDAYEGTGDQGLSAIDTDADGILDYLDTDSDNDGKTDTQEAGFTTAPNNLDADGDGLLNGYDDVDTTGGVYDSNDDQNNGAIDLPNNDVITTTEVDYREAAIDDNDNDGIADSIDLDDDNDGILDTVESTTGTDPSADDDADGIENYRDTDFGPDTNSDGIVDLFDTDLDGVPNHFDLDADNDGIYDAVEAGHDQAHTNGLVDGAVGTDGIPNTVQAAGQQNSGAVNYTLSDSESTADGTPDYLELDADNDGCNDVTEAGFTDGDGDGILGESPLVVDANGVVTGTNVSDGYTEPANVDSATDPNYDFQQPGTTPSITNAANQPQDVLTNGSTPETFAVTANGSNLTYQWEVDNQLGGGFVAIDDANATDIYTGSTTAVLTLNGITASENGYVYRVIITDASFGCSPLTSATATLTVDVTAPVITIDVVAGDDVINAVEDDAPVTISGTTDAEDGQIVTVVVNGNSYTATVTGGTWSLDIPAVDAQALDALETITADVTDLAGNAATQATRDIEHDVLAVINITTPIEGDNIVNASEDGDVTISGTTTDVEDGQIVTVTFSDGTNTVTVTATVAGNTWTATDADISGLDNGTVTVTADVTDVAGNPATDNDPITLDNTL
ncbi:Ig-like domain-containing protein, partial [Croceivirga radicis]|uniref:Ig-like domain-containing protein n=1 Tax=Croceivirga radicis TaxID=1929488 RepID=UPI000255B3DC